MEFIHADPSNEADILDFINYVFSEAARPHDFKKMVPFVYGKSGFSNLHFIAQENGRIKGTVALLPFTMRMGDKNLKAGFIGSVSVHPYERGRGIMKGLMKDIHNLALDEHLDIVFLSGRRHRYKYFGYERCGTHFKFIINNDSLRHALNFKDNPQCELLPFCECSKEHMNAAYSIYRQQQLVCAKRNFDEFTEKAKSWGNKGYVFIKDGSAEGYFVISEKNSVDEISVNKDSLKLCLKQICLDFGNAQIVCPVWDKELFESAEEVSEGCHIVSSNMMRVYNWENVLDAAIKLNFKQKALEKGRAVFFIEGAGTFCLEVSKKDARAYKTSEAPQLNLTQEEAVSVLFSPMGIFKASAFHNWLPLSSELSTVDGF